jgi:hypothetical protein
MAGALGEPGRKIGRRRVIEKLVRLGPGCGSDSGFLRDWTSAICDHGGLAVESHKDSTEPRASPSWAWAIPGDGGQ